MCLSLYSVVASARYSSIVSASVPCVASLPGSPIALGFSPMFGAKGSIPRIFLTCAGIKLMGKYRGRAHGSLSIELCSCKEWFSWKQKLVSPDGELFAFFHRRTPFPKRGMDKFGLFPD